jgi:16S rRNA G966 N2-methylase RsmD
LARAAKHIYTVDIAETHLEQARYNVQKAGLLNRVTFISGDIMDSKLRLNLPTVDAIFIDPDWADDALDHDYRFINSETRPPADKILKAVLEMIENVAIILPPLTPTKELSDLPPYELENLFMDDNHELICLYFGKLKRSNGVSEYRIDHIN